MADYDSAHFDPPAPVAVVTLRQPGTERSVSDVALLMDTGADVTLLPKSAVARLGLDVAGGRRFELVGFDGSRSEAIAVKMELLFLNRLFRGEYLLVDAEQGVMGRDVLNHLALVLDGPRQQWQEQPPGS